MVRLCADGESVLIDEFEKETGIRLRAEDFVDGGCYNNAFRCPSERFQKYRDFVQRFVSRTIGSWWTSVTRTARKR